MSALARLSRHPASLPAATAAYLLALAVFVTWPLATRLHDGSLAAHAEADLILNQYLFLWGVHALVDPGADLAHTNMFHPSPNTYGYSDMPLANSLMVAPLVGLGATADQMYGLWLLASLVIGGAGVAALARRLGLSHGAAMVAATVYLANPAHVARYRNPNQFGDHWLPWLLWALLGWLVAVGLGRAASGARAPAAPAPWREVAWRSVLVAALLVLQALSGSHGAVFGAILGAVIVVGAILAGRSRLASAEVAGRFLTGASVIVLLATVCLLPVFGTYAAVYGELVAGRLGDPAEETRVIIGGAAGARELLSGASDFWIGIEEKLGWPGAWLSPERRLRAHLFPGLLPLLAAGLGLAVLMPRARPRGRQLLLWTLDGVVLASAVLGVGVAYSGEYPAWLPGVWALLLPAMAALSARLVLDPAGQHLLVSLAHAVGDRIRRYPALMLVTGLFLLCALLALGPDGGLYWLFRWIPGVRLIRAPSRFWLPALLFLACLAGFGFETWRRRIRHAGLAAALAGLLFLAEAEMISLRVWPVPYPPDEITLWLAEQPEPLAVVEFPIDTGPPAAVRQMIRSTEHWKPLLVGYSGSEPPGYLERMDLLARTFPGPRAITLLRELDVGFVVVDRSRLDASTLRAITTTDALEAAVRFGPREIYRLR